MKIGIITFHCADNYGAVLQTYATQQWLISQGHDPWIINYRPEFILRRYKWLFLNKKFPFTYNIRNLLCAPARLVRHLKFKKFTKRYFRLCDLDLTNSNHDFDLFIFGSDQIWNEGLTGSDMTYLAQCEAFKKTKCISLAASDGGSRYENLCSYLSSFESIGVREKQLYDFLIENHINCELNCDPTLLVPRDVFESLCHKTKPQIVTYEVIPNPLTEKIAHLISDRIGVKIKKIKSDINPYENFGISRTDSVESFLSNILHAEFVVTTSFHATIFAILFNKPFFTIDLGIDENDRLKTLLESLNLLDRYIYHEIPQGFNEIDYKYVNPLIQKIKTKTEKYLIHNISK